MRLLSRVYRVISNFIFLSLVYFSLNFMEQYQHRAIVAILVLSLCRDARGIGTTLVLFLPENRAA